MRASPFQTDVERRECLHRHRDRHARLVDAIRRTTMDPSYRFAQGKLLDEKLRFLSQFCERVLDVGKSSRERFSFFDPAKISTTDFYEYDGYPDIVDDICAPAYLPKEHFDAVICLAVLEHVYAPEAAAASIRSLLRPGGYCLVYVPFLYLYHAPRDLKGYQDYFRFTRDGVAFLFREFREVTIYPVRGRLSTVLNLLPGWHSHVERYLGESANRFLDFFAPFLDQSLHASGYYVWARR